MSSSCDGYRAGGLRYWDAIDPDLFDQPAPDAAHRLSVRVVAADR